MYVCACVYVCVRRTTYNKTIIVFHHNATITYMLLNMFAISNQAFHDKFINYTINICHICLYIYPRHYAYDAITGIYQPTL